jgi:Tol biopolymer transport system component
MDKVGTRVGFPFVGLVTAFFLAISAFLGISGGAQATSPARVDPPPLLAFGGAEGIYLTSSDGHTFRHLVAIPSPFPSDPAWAHDGKRLAYVQTQQTPCVCRFDIYSIAIQHSVARRITHQGRNTSPSWSPSGREIAFSGSNAIFVVNSDGSNLRRVTPFGMNGIPVWSPDGAALAFGWSGHGTYVVRLNRDRIARISEIPAPFPTWSPDGRYLAVADAHGYVCKHDCGSRLYLIDVARMTTRRVAREFVEAWDPAWSPSGRAIAMVGKLRGEKEVGVYVVERGVPRRIGPYRISASAPQWSADGKILAFKAIQPCRTGTCETLFTVKASGGKPIPVSRNVDLQGSRFSWQPL